MDKESWSLQTDFRTVFANSTFVDSFVEQELGAGEFESEGQFTVSSSKAFEKASLYLLAFEGAWIVKLVQSIVSSQSQSPIDVTQDRNSTRIRFEFGMDVEGSDVFKSFFRLESESPSMNHLITALRAVGVAERRPFWLSFSQQTEFLHWDGSELLMGRHESCALGSELVVSYTCNTEPELTRRERFKASRKRITAESTALAQRCFVCPLPLSLDGRRLDKLQHCPEYGWGSDRDPLRIGYVGEGLPHLDLPLGTFEDPKEKSPSLNIPKVKSVATAFALTFHAKLAEKEWVGKEIHSQCCWVVDGAILQRENYEFTSEGCGVAIYLNAEGIKLDLSGFGLVESEERDSRRILAAQLVSGSLPKKSNATPHTERGTSDEKITPLIVAGCLFVVAMNGGLMAAAMSLGVLGSKLKEIREARNRSRQGIEQSLNTFVQEWCQTFAITSDQQSDQ